MKTKTKVAIFVPIATAVIASLIGIIPSIIKDDKNTETESSPREISEKSNVEVAKVHFNGSGWMHGFHTGKGYIITLTTDNLTQGKTFPISWISINKPSSMTVVVEKKGSLAPSATLLRIQENNWSKYTLKTRVSTSLNEGDKVIRYISDSDSTPGTIKDVGIDTKIGKGKVRKALITSSILGPGDAGAPVLDENGKVVGMAVASILLKKKSISVPIERIKADFPHAF